MQCTALYCFSYRVDDMFAAAFEGSGATNRFLLHSLTPLTLIR
jgi:hypothetical protein